MGLAVRNCLRQELELITNSAVMLSEALQLNARHEARFSNISGLFRFRADSDLIRDGEPQRD